MIKYSLLMPFIFLIISCGTKTSQENSQDNSNITKEKVVNDLNVTKLADKNLPSEIAFEGDLKNAIKWEDIEGIHIVLIAETDIHVSKKFEHENEGSDAELFAYHYRLDKEERQYKLVWKIYDFISDCPVDIIAEFIDNTFQITDLDNDGVAEIWTMYLVGCHGDVSPEEMKIIMYEGDTKHAMRGYNQVSFDETNTYGGDYTFDHNFAIAAPEFRDHAIQMWDKNKVKSLN